MKKIQPKEGESADIVSENIERLKELFPEAFSESGVNFDVLHQLLGDAKVLDEGEEKYGLNWHGKKRARQIALTPSTGTLLPCPEESINWDTTKNLFIEGDNLEVLKLLQKSYANKVKMIYIDPPYNTGKEFIYPDKFQENLDTYLKYTGQVDDEGMKFSSNTESTGRKHTNWLSMMYPRLKLAKQLLSQEGVIFITIDDNEVATLRQVCDEIFGEENFVTSIVWQKKVSPSNDATWFSSDHDHILVYAKNKLIWRPFKLPMNERQKSNYTNPDNDPRGNWNSATYTCNKDSDERPNLYYPLVNPNTGQDVWPKKTAVWKYSREVSQKHAEENIIYWGKDGTSNSPRLKKFLSKAKGVVPRTVWLYSDVGHTQEATKVLSELIDDIKFDTPKPVRLIEHMLRISTGGDSEEIVLDFFAGSASTAHAILNINANEGSNRRFIMVQLPELLESESYRSIADIGKRRVKEAGKKITNENPDATFDQGFKVFKLSSSNIQAWNPDRQDLEQSLLSQQEHLIEGRSENDILYELLLKRGVDLAVPIESREVLGKNIYSIGYGVLFACLDESINKDQVEEIGQSIVEWHRELAPSSDTHVFFRDSAFSDDVSKTNMAAILEQSGITHVRSL
ncbi:Site-specific DNA-methyltransferase (adenine-specific) [Nitrosococcus oceani ATCC 19707]|uniref:site-specific DNA-methyltransferase (adenine-specific) n=2 Tax=Nitrosococcus oceani TaxID=1229 RepID=Q3J723_NITOC|nr:site-specific DNA-methyltransferase [Nitrosococcus oceani]ABA59373.1 Site-specific DNA-methyltransferase (adenine-specific) [Nitrosococcus oceani ATCC 19707]EDZ65569.1 DNA methylase domain protein [Nitrosococcus oceani AFC27]KFI18109.1 DNA methyltransferase [Nitrosococcus oceani C-27]GEM20056.1 site-specific DNA-methyltransferase [Nitrosococcus oceani]